MSSLDSAELSPPPILSTPSSDRRNNAADIAVQVSHRAAILAFFSFLAALGLLYVGNNVTGVTWAVAAVFVFANIGASAALLGRSMHKPLQRRREATIVLLFNAALWVLSLQLMLLTRLELFRGMARAFFKPE